ncbi:hypothetical protein [Clostridium sp.]|uniref:DUF1659 domain-containing protein n=1 Tax=Clostridium sp. TaxID=1506 RepID=UPI00346409ED
MANSTISKSLLNLKVIVGKDERGNDKFKKVRVGLLDEGADDTKIYEVSKEIEKFLAYPLGEILKENTYSIEN